MGLLFLLLELFLYHSASHSFFFSLVCSFRHEVILVFFRCNIAIKRIISVVIFVYLSFLQEIIWVFRIFDSVNLGNFNLWRSCWLSLAHLTFLFLAFFLFFPCLVCCNLHSPVSFSFWHIHYLKTWLLFALFGFCFHFSNHTLAFRISLLFSSGFLSFFDD